MKIDFKKGTGEIEGECPVCSIPLEISGLPRWNSFAKCPKCNADLKFDFDFYIVEGDECDIYEIKKGSPIF